MQLLCCCLLNIILPFFEIQKTLTEVSIVLFYIVLVDIYTFEVWNGVLYQYFQMVGYAFVTLILLVSFTFSSVVNLVLDILAQCISIIVEIFAGMNVDMLYFVQIAETD